MASVRKKGTGYEVRISDGYDSAGKKIEISRMFNPKPGLTEEKAKLEAHKFALRLEDRIKNGDNVKADKLTVEKLSKYFLEDVKPPEIARTTYTSVSYTHLNHHPNIQITSSTQVPSDTDTYHFRNQSPAQDNGLVSL